MVQEKRLNQNKNSWWKTRTRRQKNSIITLFVFGMLVFIPAMGISIYKEQKGWLSPSECNKVALSYWEQHKNMTTEEAFAFRVLGPVMICLAFGLVLGLLFHGFKIVEINK